MTTISRQWVLLLVAIAASGVMAGCFTKKYPVKRRYVFEIYRTGEPSTPAAGVLRVGRIRVSPLFERKSFVYRTSDGTFEDDFYNEFFAAPAQVLRRVTLVWIKQSAIFSAVQDARDGGGADWLLEGRAEKLYADLRDRGKPRAVLEIEFILRDLRSPRRPVAFQKKYSTETAASRASAAAIMEAWNISLAQILRELEADLREQLST